MDILRNIISQMNKEEIRHFKLFANRTNERDQRKDLILFDEMKQKIQGPFKDFEFYFVAHAVASFKLSNFFTSLKVWRAILRALSWPSPSQPLASFLRPGILRPSFNSCDACCADRK